MSNTDPLLDVRNLRTKFFTDDGVVDAVSGVSFTVARGQSVGIVGESGSGKSVTAMSILRMVAKPGRVTGGSIWFNNQDLLALPESAMRRIRGNAISLIFQEPMTSLDPLYTVGNQIGEAIALHQGLSGAAATDAGIRALKDVGIPDAEHRYHAYPHQLSGGMRQRVMIAIALSCRPDLLIADEPTTALDVTIQAKILDLIRALRQERNMALLLITHNLGIVAQMCDYVVVMFKGKIVEHKPVAELFAAPEHPYTQALLASIPRLTSPPKTPLPIMDMEAIQPPSH